MICILAAGGLLRVLTLIFLPKLVWADEVFQYVEPSAKLLGGHALTPWEYQVGARSWLLPLFILPAVAFGRLISDVPDAVYACVAAQMIALSLGGALAAYRIGCGAAGRLHGLFAAFVISIWFEAIYISPHPLADSMSAALLLIALAACLQAATMRQILAAGALLGLTFVVRLQLAPALGLFGLVCLWRAADRRSAFFALGLAAGLPVLFAGLLDWATWGAPFHSYLTYIRANEGGVASSFGTSPWNFFPRVEWLLWGWATPFILTTAYFGARRLPMALAAAVVIVATFSAVAHKEYRFIFPALALLLTLCGIGTAELVRLVGARWALPSIRLPFLLAAIWVFASLLRAMSPVMIGSWIHQRDTLEAMRAISADPAACGVAVAPKPAWARTGASHFRDDIALYRYTPEGAPAFNYYLAFWGAPPPQQPFTQLSCSRLDLFCLYKRPGGCTGAGVPLDAPPPPKTEAALRRLGLL